jgi:hypothetical protein
MDYALAIVNQNYMMQQLPKVEALEQLVNEEHE